MLLYMDLDLQVQSSNIVSFPLGALLSSHNMLLSPGATALSQAGWKGSFPSLCDILAGLRPCP